MASHKFIPGAPLAESSWQRLGVLAGWKSDKRSIYLPVCPPLLWYCSRLLESVGRVRER